MVGATISDAVCPLGIYFLDFLGPRELCALSCTCWEFKAMTQVIFETFNSFVKTVKVFNFDSARIVQLFFDILLIDVIMEKVTKSQYQVIIHYTSMLPREGIAIIDRVLLTKIVKHPQYFLLIEILTCGICYYYSDYKQKNAQYETIKDVLNTIVVDNRLKPIMPYLKYHNNTSGNFGPLPDRIHYRGELKMHKDGSIPFYFVARKLHQTEIWRISEKDAFPYAKQLVYYLLLKSTMRRLKYPRWHTHFYDLTKVLQAYLEVVDNMPRIVISDINLRWGKNMPIAYAHLSKRIMSLLSEYDPIFAEYGYCG